MIVSVHIPKCGGTSFRNILEVHFGHRLLLDYGDRPMSKSTLTRNVSALSSAPRNINIRKSVDCIHGHFLPIKYRLAQGAKRVIWFREPAQRLASRYGYWKNRRQKAGRPKDSRIDNVDLSFEEFCRLPHFHNIYSKFLWGVSLESFDFVGITEDYDQNIQLFCESFDISPPAITPKVNTNPKKQADTYDIPNDLLCMIHRLNPADYQIYEEALRINEKMIKKHDQ
jgi:Sulfotransferase family